MSEQKAAPVRRSVADRLRHDLDRLQTEHSFAVGIGRAAIASAIPELDRLAARVAELEDGLRRVIDFHGASFPVDGQSADIMRSMCVEALKVAP